jgi:DNA-binding NtrC family response regulator
MSMILLLISDPLVRSVVGDALERGGHVVVRTDDVGTAVDWLKQSTPDLLIIRSFIASMPGHEAAQYLRARCPSMRVLILGGLLNDERLLNREELAGFEIFPKPYSATEFIDYVDRVLAKPRG